MPNQLHAFLAEDHERLDALLRACLEEIDPEKYDEFRRGLLRHIGIEELVLFPLLRRSKGATELEAQLHRDHAALSALLMPPPTRTELGQIAEILGSHNDLEELPGGLYEIIESLAGGELDALMTKVHAIPPVRVARQADSPVLRRTIEQLLREAEEGRRRMAGSGGADAPVSEQG
jgi:hypothetical protein